MTQIFPNAKNERKEKNSFSPLTTNYFQLLNESLNCLWLNNWVSNDFLLPYLNNDCAFPTKCYFTFSFFLPPKFLEIFRANSLIMGNGGREGGCFWVFNPRQSRVTLLARNWTLKCSNAFQQICFASKVIADNTSRN